MSLCRDQYVELLDHLRPNYLASLVITDVVDDLMDFLMKLEFLQAREHLLHFFKLCCLCVISVGPAYPGVKVGSIDTFDQRGRFIDVVLPAQSYLSGVPDSVTLRVNDANLARFSLLSASFGRTAFSAGYDPWERVDDFGR